MMRQRWIAGLIVGMCGLYFSGIARAEGPAAVNDPQPVETMTMSPAQAAQAGGTEQAVMEAMEAVAAAMQPGSNAAPVPQSPAAPKAPQAAQNQNPKPGVYDEDQMKKMIEEAKKNGQIVFVQISATWCGPCAAAIKKMQEMMDKYKDVAVYIVVEVGVTAEEMKEYQEKHKGTIFVGVPGENPPADYPASSYPSIYYTNGTQIILGSTGVPDAATLQKWEEAMKKAQKDMK